MIQYQTQAASALQSDPPLRDLAARLLAALKDCEDKVLLCVRCDGLVGFDGIPKAHEDDCSISALIAEAEQTLHLA